MSEFQLPVISVFFISLSLSYALSRFSLKLKNNTSRKNNENEIRLSNLKISTYGGIAMSISFFVSTRFLGKADFEIIQIAFYALLITLIGYFDDKYNLNWKLKLLFQIFSVATPVYFLKIYLSIENFLGINFNNYLDLVITTLWVVLLVNALNFLDNMDGLAATTAVMILIFLAVLSYITQQYKLTDITIVLIGSVVGFLFFNLPPAKLYMGDSGSLFLGYCLGFISILFTWNATISTSWAFQIQPVILFFTIPILDFATVFISRLNKGVSPMTGGTDHISHRLLNKGYSTLGVLTIFISISLFIFSIALGIIFFNQLVSVILLFFYFATVLILLLFFLNLETLN